EDLEHGREDECRRAPSDRGPEERRRPERDVLREERFDCGAVRRGDGALPAPDELLAGRYTHGDTLCSSAPLAIDHLRSTHARRSCAVRARTNGGGGRRRPGEGPFRLRALAGRRARLRPPPVRARRAERRLRSPRDRRLSRLLYEVALPAAAASPARGAATRA